MNKLILMAAALATVTLATSCGDNEQAAQTSEPAVAEQATASVTAMAWLSGRWEMATPEGIVFEDWTAAGSDEMAGKGGFIKGSDTMISETIQLRVEAGKLVYVPTVKGQNNDQPVTFTLSTAAGDSFVFENPAHDFPQAITYKKLGDTAMEARISGKIEGKDAAEGFVLQRKR